MKEEKFNNCKKNKNERTFQTVIVGNSNVGKTSLLVRYKNDTFMDPNCVIYHGISTDIKDGRVIYRIHFIDTIGSREKLSLSHLQYSKFTVFILCFAINDKESYSNIQNHWFPELKSCMVNNPLILVGTKSDLMTERRIDIQQGKRLQKECNAAFYIECSSKTGSGINDVVKAVLLAYKSALKKKKRKLQCVIT